jgi:hypothetical protein
MPDVAVVPMVAYAVSAAYSVDVFAYGSLRFDLPTLADIYLGKSRTPTHHTHTHTTRAVADGLVGLLQAISSTGTIRASPHSTST